jgi:hypothetical protein
MVTLEDLKRLIREELTSALDVHSSFSWEKALREGVDAHFNCIVDDLSSPPNVTIEPASSYWVLTKQTDLPEGYLVCPATKSGLALYSKRAFNYGHIAVKTKLPDMTGYASNAWIFFGFENGWAAGNGIAAFKWDANNNLWAVLATPFWKRGPIVDLTNMLPSDYQTAYHVYSIKLNRNMAVFYIDTKAVCYGLFTPNSYFTPISGPPYALFSVETEIASSQLALIEIGGRGKELKLDLPYYNVRVIDGDPCPPMVIRLYQSGTNTLLAGLSLSSGSVTSHPVPIFGYRDKTIYFQTDQSGIILIEILTQTGNWRTYDSDTVSAKTLWWYKMTGDAVLARITFTPYTYPCTILDAEVVLSD